MKKKPTPTTAIISGIGIIGFSLLYFFTGIFPSRTTWSPGRVVTATENPLRFRFAVFASLVIGVVCLVWGLLKSMRR